MKRSSLLIHLAFVVMAFFVVHDSAYAIDSQGEWDAAFNAQYPSQDPLLNDPGTAPGNSFAWTGHFWIRAYVKMADTFSDTKYCDKAVALIDHMLYYRDDAAVARGDWSILDNPYALAPPYYLNHPDEAAPGWTRIYEDERRIETVTDGMIIQAIMFFVDLVYNDSRFYAYQTKAEYYILKVKETIACLDENFVYDRSTDIPGSYYWPNADGSGLGTNPIPYNQSANMGVAFLLLDRIEGGSTEYRNKAEAIIEYWRGKVQTVNNAYVWTYHLQKMTIEDFNHGDADMIFFMAAFNAGILTHEEMVLLSNTFTQNAHLGSNNFAQYIDGTGASSERFWAGISWIYLYQFNSEVLPIVKGTYNTYYNTPAFAHSYLGWANIFYIDNLDTESPAVPQNLRIVE